MARAAAAVAKPEPATMGQRRTPAARIPAKTPHARPIRVKARRFG
jgi:hypothetical protein